MAMLDKVGHYEILELLGRGGMGAVYRARDLILGRQVALKFLSSDFQKDNEAVDRFIQEAKSVAQLDHPNICTIYEIGKHGESSFIAMEFLDGATLKHLIATMATASANSAPLTTVSLPLWKATSKTMATATIPRSRRVRSMLRALFPAIAF